MRGTLFGNPRDIPMIADIHTPTVRVIKLGHNADVD
jgi:hypothetical protein